LRESRADFRLAPVWSPPTNSPCNKRFRAGPSCRLGGFEPGAQNFRDAPGLRDATAGVVWFARVEHFTDRPDSGVVQVIGKPREKFSRSRAIVRMNFEPGIDKWTD